MGKPRIVSVKEFPTTERRPPDMEGKKVVESYSPKQQAEESPAEQEHAQQGFLARFASKIRSIFGR